MRSTNADFLQFIIIGTILFLLVALFMVSFLFLYRKRHHRHLRETRELETRFQQELLHAQLEMQEETLKKIAQEIHDNIGQTLSLAKLNLNTLDPTKPNVLEKTLLTKELVGKAINDLRHLSKSLHTDAILASGIVDAVAYELNLLQKTGVCQTALQVEGTVLKLDAQKELILFRLVQEALNNIIKHAQAAEVRVLLLFEAGRLHLSISDDGCGFEPAAVAPGLQGGSGLRNMQNRARLIGGSCNIQSARGSGTTIELRIPYNPPL